MSEELSQQNEEKWKEEDRKRVKELLDTYLVAKDKWKSKYGDPNRYKLHDNFKEIEKELFYRLPEETHHRGFVIKKGYNNYGVYLQVFTEESWARTKNYMNSKGRLDKQIK